MKKNHKKRDEDKLRDVSQLIGNVDFTYNPYKMKEYQKAFMGHQNIKDAEC